jgi:hypothetical protein
MLEMETFCKWPGQMMNVSFYITKFNIPEVVLGCKANTHWEPI